MLATSGTVEIPLPDDDPQAMITMCKIMHICPEIMENFRASSHLASLARHADKYDTVRVLGPVTYYWISRALDRASVLYHGNLMIAAYDFNHTELFERAGKSIVMFSILPHLTHTHPELSENMRAVFCKRRGSGHSASKNADIGSSEA